MADDPLQQLAEDLAADLAAVEALASVTIDGEPYPVTYEWTDTPRVDLADSEIKTPLVWVLEASETLGSDKTPTYDECELLIVVQMKVLSQDLATETAKALQALCASIARFVKPVDDTYTLNEAVCVKAFRKAKDGADWHEKGRFYCEIATTWRF